MIKDTEMLERFAKSLGAEKIVAAIIHDSRRCGAKTRAGTPCKLPRVSPLKNRCKFHGGMSTGPRTEEGQKRSAEASRQRMLEYWRKKKNAES